MSLTSAGLPISQDRGIVSLQHREHALLGGVLVDKLLRGVLVIDVVEGETLPYTEVRILIHVLLPLFFSDFSTKVLHDATAFVLGADLHNRAELTPGNFLSLKRRSDPDNHPKVLTSRLVHSLGADGAMVSATSALAVSDA